VFDLRVLLGGHFYFRDHRQDALRCVHQAIGIDEGSQR
jgi:surfactin synthase thioesterase subunit